MKTFSYHQICFFVILLFAFDACQQAAKPAQNTHSEISKICFAFGCCGSAGKVKFTNTAISIDSSLKYYYLKIWPDSSKYEVDSTRISRDYWDTLVGRMYAARFKQLDTLYTGSDGAPSEMIVYYGGNIKRVKGVTYNFVIGRVLSSVLYADKQYKLVPAKVAPIFETKAQFIGTAHMPKELIEALKK